MGDLSEFTFCFEKLAALAGRPAGEPLARLLCDARPEVSKDCAFSVFRAAAGWFLVDARFILLSIYTHSRSTAPAAVMLK